MRILSSHLTGRGTKDDRTDYPREPTAQTGISNIFFLHRSTFWRALIKTSSIFWYQLKNNRLILCKLMKYKHIKKNSCDSLLHTICFYFFRIFKKGSIFFPIQFAAFSQRQRIFHTKKQFRRAVYLNFFPWQKNRTTNFEIITKSCDIDHLWGKNPDH